MEFSVKRMGVSLLCLTFLVGCVEKPLLFSGESDYWEVEFQPNSNDKNCDSSMGYIKYIGEAPAPESVEY